MRELMRQIVDDKGWMHNVEAQVYRLYLIGKAKSLAKGRWMWRPTVANLQAIVAK